MHELFKSQGIGRCVCVCVCVCVCASRLSDAFLFLTRSKNTDHFTVWLYFDDKQVKHVTTS
jgi:hypothetical protein